MLKADLVSAKVTSLRLLSGSSEITLSTQEHDEYLTYANLLLTLKHSILAGFLQNQSYDLNSAEFNPIT